MHFYWGLEQASFKMAREINMDTLNQNFWAEAINKEASLRLALARRQNPQLGVESTKKILERHAAKLRSYVPKPAEREENGVTLPSVNVLYGRCGVRK